MKKILLAIYCLCSGLIAFAQPVTTTFNYTGSVQTFTVPSCVTSLTIETRGAQGGAVTAQSPFPQGGLGATMIGDFTVAPGDVLSLVVGGRGNSDPSSSGGGGGSGVNLNGTALIVAGGGAGVDFQDPTFTGQDAVITSDGVTGNGGGGAGGTAGSAGGNNVYSGNNISQGGNGWNDGNTGSTGLSGSSPNTTFTSGTWGLGGGGGSVGYGWCNCGGGGGGYSGGGSGQINQSGGGGGSYNAGTNQNNTPGNNSGNGLIIITYNAGSGPSAPGTITGSTSVCLNSTNISYSISPVAGATGYTWSVPAGSTISSGQGTSSIIMQPGSAGGTISVTADNSCGSSVASTLTITVNPIPAVNLGSDITQCGGTVVLDAQNSGSAYLWSDASTNQTLTVSASGTYSVVVTDANGCSGSDGINITINALPTVTGTASTNNACLGDADVILTGVPSGGIWSGPGVTGSSFSPSTAGTGPQTLTYTYTDINGCTNTATTVITVNICTVTENLSLSNGINIFPNPNNGQFTLVVNAEVGDLKITVTDLQGRVVYSSVESNVHAGYLKQVNLNNQSAGIYFMQISGGGEQRTDKISVQK
jgi:hypothetical protein